LLIAPSPLILANIFLSRNEAICIGVNVSFYEKSENVDKYIEMCKGYDGSNLHQFLAKYLKQQSSLLELGCGSGNDIALLKHSYQVVGSDNSLEFINRCKSRHPEVEFVQLNAVSLKLEQNFDCIYSNKVLHHLSESELRESLKQQSDLLADRGLVAHSFWLGEGCDEMEGLLFNYYSKQQIVSIISDYFNVTDTLEYQEFEEGDSIFIVARKVV
jgi:SAM-dependent methyltransferase